LDLDWSKSRLVEMSWEDILKNSRRSKRKREPYNPFTGKGVKGSEITEKKKEIEQERKDKIKDETKLIPRARVAINLGGGSRLNRKWMKERHAHSQRRDPEKAKSLNSKSKCAQCGIRLTENQRFQTINNASNLYYCENCIKSIEGKEAFHGEGKYDLGVS